MSRYNPVTMQKGEGISVFATFRSGGVVTDLTGAVAAIPESDPATLAPEMTATIELRNGVWGVACSLPAAQSALLSEGNVQWFRVSVTFPDERPDVSRKQWVNVE